jgi:HAD superfamily hydrolase (TIGR01509 family)
VKPVVFLDSGGVINDNQARAPQWRPLVADYFVPRLGGTHEAWMRANRVMMERFFTPTEWQKRLARARGYEDFDREYARDWLLGMCELVGVTAPQDAEAVALARAANAEIFARVQAPFPGAAEAIVTLHEGGFTLHTASGEPSAGLHAILSALGVRHCFGRLYGPDLVDTVKAGPEYYARVFSDSGVSPSETIVVDDSPLALSWAACLGARTVLVQKEPPPGWAAASVGSISELPQLIGKLV